MMPGLYFNKGNEKRMSITYTGGEREVERGRIVLSIQQIYVKRDDGTCMSSITLEEMKKYIYFIIIFDAAFVLLHVLRKKVLYLRVLYLSCI